MGNFVDELYYKQCNHEGSDINKSPLLMSKSTSNMYHEGYDIKLQKSTWKRPDFNPRTHEGYDTHGRLIAYRSHNFNPRTHEGYDHGFWTRSGAPGNFNPRTHEGYDIIIGIAGIQKYISIHVPTKGTTEGTNIVHFGDNISIHVPTKGTTKEMYFDAYKKWISIHVPTKGTTFYVTTTSTVPT